MINWLRLKGLMIAGAVPGFSNKVLIFPGVGKTIG